MVNLCYRVDNNNKEEIDTTNKLYKKTSIVAGIQQTFLTKDGNKIKEGTAKKQLCFSNYGISGNPVVLKAKGDNNGFIYVTEGIENGLSIQEYVNNEVWCALSIVNIPNLPFENDKVYIFVLDNDYHKNTCIKQTEEKEEALKELGVKYKTEYNEERQQRELYYNSGEYSHKNLLSKLRRLKNKKFLYLIPKEAGKDVNDLLKQSFLSTSYNQQDVKDIKYINRLEELLNEAPLPIECESTLKFNRKTKEVVYWKPLKPFTIADTTSDKLAIEFVKDNLSYNSASLAERFKRRYGDIYKLVDGIGVCKYKDGIYAQNCEGELFDDIVTTVALTYYEYNYITNNNLKESFKRLWARDGYEDTKTILSVKNFIINSASILEKVDVDQFDNPEEDIINLSNGYYNLVENKLYEHNKNKCFFKKLNIKYNDDINLNNPNADWNKFLRSCLCENDYDTKGLNNIRFLQKAMGYTFGSNNTNEEKVFMLLGQTRTGKSTCIDVIQEVMSSYSAGTQSEEFLTNDDTSNNYILGIKASLKGKRFLHISEISKSKRLNAAEIKRIAGDRFITAKYIYQQPFTFRNTVKYWISTNNIDFNNNEFDESVKSKLAIINFNRRFYEAGTEEAIKTGRVIDKNLKNRLLTPYNKQFILKWIIEGYRLYKKEGLEQTEEMKQTLEDIQSDNDSLSCFIKDELKEYNPIKYELVGAKKTLSDVANYEINSYHTPEDRIISFKKFVKCVRAKGFHIERKWSINNNRKELFITDWCLNEEIKTRKEIKTEESEGGGGGTDYKQ